MSAFHVAFLVDRALIESALDALREYADGRDRDVLLAVLGRAWAARQVRRRTRTCALAASERDDLVGVLADVPPLSQAVSRAPVEVREAALHELRRHSALYVRVRSLDAPPVVVKGMRARVEEAIARLAPDTEAADEPVPELAVVSDAGGRELINVHDWLDQLLRAARSPDRPLVGLGSAFAAASEDEVEQEAEGGGWPGIEYTCYGMDPGSSIWCAPQISLPHAFGAGGAIVVGTAGGPMTYAVAGDPRSPDVAVSLLDVMSSLTKDSALVSFAALENDVDWPWEDPPH